MRRSRVPAVLATLVATVAMALGTAVAGSSPAAAKPHYPPPPPKLTVNKGVVKYGDTVRVRGYRYIKYEKISVTVKLRPRGSHRWQTVKRVTTSANRKGEFSAQLRMARPGTVVIEAYGYKSRSRASVTVYVIDKRRGGGGWTWRNVAFDADRSAPVAGAVPVAAAPAVTTAAPARQPADHTAALAAAGLAALGLAGSVLFTRRVVRRRRSATVTD